MGIAKVAIIDRDPGAICTLLQSANREHFDCRHTSFARSGQEGLKLILSDSPNIVITDINLPDINGLDMISEARHIVPETLFIILSECDDFNCIRKAIQLGVFDYLLKSSDADELAVSLQRAVMTVSKQPSVRQNTREHSSDFDHTDDNSGLLTDMCRRVGELVEVALLTDESADYAASELVHLCGQQYVQLRNMVSLYAMLLIRKFPCDMNESIDKALNNTWIVTEESSVATCLRNICSALRTVREEERSGYSLLTRNILDYIHLHGTEKLSLGDVASQFYVSANYLSALIRKETGINFHDHVTRVRMDTARKMLADPRIFVEEIAYAVGYGNYVSFYNVFKQEEHMTPTAYRTMLAKR